MSKNAKSRLIGVPACQHSSIVGKDTPAIFASHMGVEVSTSDPAP